MGRAGQGITLRQTHGSTGFMERGACRAADPKIFYEETKSKLRHLDNPRIITALGFCANCPVKARCAEWAAENNETGIWGGQYFDRGRPEPLKVRDGF